MTHILISQGTYSEVYKVIELGRAYALKKYTRTRVGSIDINAVKEADILLRLKHANIVKLHHVYREYVNGVSEMCLELELAEQNLRQYIRHQSEPKPHSINSDQISIMHGVLCGLAFLHDNDIIHQDLKPENILLFKGIPKIADFNLARICTSSDRVASAKGIPSDALEEYEYTHTIVSLWWRAPELLVDELSTKVTYYTKAIDIWSLGCIFHQLLTKKYIVNGETDIECLYQIILRINEMPERLLLHTDPFHKEMLRGVTSNAKESGIDIFREYFGGVHSKWLPFILRLLDTDPKHRITAFDAANHTLFGDRKYVKSLPEITKSVSGLEKKSLLSKSVETVPKKCHGNPVPFEIPKRAQLWLELYKKIDGNNQIIFQAISALDRLWVEINTKNSSCKEIHGSTSTETDKDMIYSYAVACLHIYAKLFRCSVDLKNIALDSSLRAYEYGLKVRTASGSEYTDGTRAETDLSNIIWKVIELLKFRIYDPYTIDQTIDRSPGETIITRTCIALAYIRGGPTDVADVELFKAKATTDEAFDMEEYFKLTCWFDKIDSGPSLRTVESFFQLLVRSNLSEPYIYALLDRFEDSIHRYASTMTRRETNRKEQFTRILALSQQTPYAELIAYKKWKSVDHIK